MLSVVIGVIVSDLYKKSFLIRIATFGYSLSVIAIFVKTKETRTVSQLLKSRVLLILCAMALLYTGYSFIVATWMPSFMQNELEIDVFQASLPVSIYWIGILAGRLSFSVLSSRFNIKVLFFSSGFITAVFIASAVIINTPIFYIVALFFAGFMLSSIIPSSVAFGCSRYSRNTGAVSSMIFFSATLGSLFLPWIFGLIGQITNLYTGFIISIIIPLLIMVLASILPSESKL